MENKWLTPHQVKLRYDLVSQKTIDIFHNNININFVTGCWEWTAGKSKSNKRYVNEYYGVISLGTKKLEYAHRMSWKIHYGKIPDNICVLHKCDNAICCNPTHLFLGTQKDNIQDKISKGRQNLPKGDRHWTRVRSLS